MKLHEMFAIEEGYSYEEAMQLDDVSPEEARAEIERHQLSWEDFVNEVGDKPAYTGEEILGWLGY